MSITSDVRRPAVAGRFYPHGERALRDRVVKLLRPVPREERPCCGCVVPHAGLEFSGGCAACVFGRIQIPDTVVILAPNHTGICASPGASLWSSGAFRTPLGDVPVNASFSARLTAACEWVGNDHLAHAEEHAIEVELPFLQVRSPGVRIVPIVLAFQDWYRCETLALALAEIIREEPGSVLLLASSDLTHFESAAAAAWKDRKALDAIERLDGELLLTTCRENGINMCGRAAAACVLEASRALGATRADTIDYRHSGQVTGDESSVVGYAGVILC